MPRTNIHLDPNCKIREASSYFSTSLQEAVKLRIGREGTAAESPLTIPQYFHENCTHFSSRPALTYANSTCNPESSRDVVTYTEYEAKVHQTALMFLYVGLQPRTSVGILAFNCPEWFYSEFAAIKAGGVVSGIYTSNSAEAVFHVLDTSDATICVVDDANQMQKLREIKTRLPKLKAVIQIHGPFEDFVGIDEGYYRWQDLEKIEFGSKLEKELQHRESQLVANECALLIYTSGTVGMPKAVMLSHDSMINDNKAIAKELGAIVQGYESCVSYLPLNHVAAQVFDVYIMLGNGGCVHFADCNALKGSLGPLLAEVRPTRFFGVPRIFEKIQDGLIKKSESFSRFQKYLFEKSRGVMTAYHLNTGEGKPSCLLYWLASKILQKIPLALGLDRARHLVIGGAPVTEELKRYYLSINLPLCDVYGLSETSGAAAFNFETLRVESIGKAINGTEIKISNPDAEGHGEICVRSRTVFMGYLNDLEKTKECLTDDGWFFTGDIGCLDSDGRLVMSGRIKELIITSGGENIPPARIEELIKKELHVLSNALLVGDKRKYLTVLLTLKTEVDPNTGINLDQLKPEVIGWLRSLGLDYSLLSEVLSIPADLCYVDASTLMTKPPQKLVEAINEGIKRANAKSLSNAQKVQKFSFLPHDFSIATGELGPTLKVRRNVILQKYTKIINSMYE